MNKTLTSILIFITSLALAAIACTSSFVTGPNQNTASISGKIAADLNGNGTTDGEEGPLDNVIVSLSGCGEDRTVLSGVDGSFQFSGLPTGVCVLEVTKGGWTYSASYPTPGYPIPVTADASQPAALVVYMRPSDQAVQAEPTPTSVEPTATQPPTNVPDLTATPGQAMVSATDRDVNCRFGPSTKYSPTDALLKGKTVPITGKTDDSSWWQVDGPNYGSGKCFLSASVTETSGDLSTVPVVQAPQASLTDVQISVKVLDVQSCDAAGIELTGKISANGPTTVKYRQILDGPSSYVSDYTTLEITEAGETPFKLTGGISKCGDYSLEFQVIEPNAISAYDEFTVSPQGSAPEIQYVYFRKDRSSGSLVIYQDIYFIDAEGDVITADWELISATVPGLTARAGTVTSSSTEQMAGTSHTGRWGCGDKKYSVTLSVTLVDKAGYRSAPKTYTMVCD